MEKDYYEVFFNQYCPLCEHREKNEYEEPCNDCLDYGWNVNSHKPVRFEKKE